MGKTASQWGLEKESVMGKDNATAEAIKVAERHLIKMGWKFDPSDVGREAAKLLKAMQAEMSE